ncbi:DNA-binding protein [Desulfurococcus mucosus]|uniref:Nucleoid protein Alba n=1 Tax=Desulfurococcus mucosus (strain ATCC 35584 / DSM 2162 / JCM 9187 / O7/1) TaxID=765177 RepID=E8R759_DESM0|nr:DNA-binding protein [Desulfurococcus mucosus]ADV65524.1 nucleoid protein Alba [Desulfurococcus mucosus DSM 2162]
MSSERVLNVGRKSLDDYIVEVILMFQEGSERVVLKGVGPYISRAVDLYNALVSRMGDSVELVKVGIGSERIKGRMKPFIAIEIRKKY